MKDKRNCFYCENCLYIGEGDYLCDMRQEIVVSTFEPTEEFMCCDGKDFVKG